MEGKDDWIKIIKSIVTSSKDDMTIEQLRRDVHCIEGEEIPYIKFGYRSLELFLRDIPNDIRLFQKDGKLIVKSKISEETAHIHNLIKQQKKSKKKPARKIRSNIPKRYYNKPVRQPQTSNSKYNNWRPQPLFFQRPTHNHTSVPYKPKSPEGPKYKANEPLPKKVTQDNSNIKITIPNIDLSRPSTPASRPTTPASRPTTPATRSTTPPQQRLHIQEPNNNAVSNQLEINDPRLKLLQFTIRKGYSDPKYLKVPNKRGEIYASVSIEEIKPNKWTSYPKAVKNYEEAEKIAAENALEELLKDFMPFNTTNDENLIIQRIVNIVKEHPNGIFQKKVAEYYKNKYKENLPVNWREVVGTHITEDAGANQESILRPRNNTEIKLENKAYVQANSNSFYNTASEPPKLNLNDLDESFGFYVYPGCVYSTTDVWGNVVGENHMNMVSVLNEEMELYYSQREDKPKSIKIGDYYAVYDSDWHRVKCLELNKEMATVFFIDRGDEDIINANMLRSLNKKFCKLPAQSIRISIEGLEEFSNNEEVRDIICDIIEENDNILIEKFTLDTSTSGEMFLNCQLSISVKDKYENLNNYISKKICEEFSSSKLLKPEKPGVDVNIVQISKEGVYVQVLSKGYDIFKNLMENLEQKIKDSILKLPPDILPKKIYLMKHNTDNQWKRVILDKLINENEVQVLLIDIGIKTVTRKANLFLLEPLSFVLENYPSQAIKIILHKISPLMFNEKMIRRFQELVLPSDIVHMKCVGKSSDDEPIVQLFKRTENNILVAINDTLVLEPEENSSNTNSTKNRIRNDRSLNPLGSLPSFNDWNFDVYISMAATPSNFTVQSRKYADALNKLMQELSEYCENYSGPVLSSEQVFEGKMYAAQYDDGGWYRAIISKSLDKNTFAVYFCDYGDYRPVNIEKLLPLTESLKDSLPKQAIKAKLHGIVPVLGDWSVSDCIRFNELVAEKNLVSKIINIEKDPHTGEMLLALDLCDTNTEKDIYIINELIKEKRCLTVKDDGNNIC